MSEQYRDGFHEMRRTTNYVSILRNDLDRASVGADETPLRRKWSSFSNSAIGIIEESLDLTSKFGNPEVSSAHLLAGLCKEEETMAKMVLHDMGVDPGGILAIATLLISNQIGERTEVMSVQTKQIIRLAAEEAREMKDDFIGTHHILLGMLKQEKNVGSAILASSGVVFDDAKQSVNRVREEIIRNLSEPQ